MTGAADLLGVAFAAWLLAGVPIVGPRRSRRLAGALRTDPGLRLGCYRASLRRLGLAAVVSAVALGLGRAAPPPPGLAGLPAPLLIALGAAAVVALAVSRSLPVPARPLLPTTPVERRLFGIVVVAAAVSEELAYRAFLPGVLLLIVPRLGAFGAALVATGAFAGAHAYQGRAAVARAGVAGLALAALYAGTGSLFAAVAGHALVDLRLALPTRRARSVRPAAAGPRRGTAPRTPVYPAEPGSAAVAAESPVARRA